VKIAMAELATKNNKIVKLELNSLLAVSTKCVVPSCSFHVKYTFSASGSSTCWHLKKSACHTCSGPPPKELSLKHHCMYPAQALAVAVCLDFGSDFNITEAKVKKVIAPYLAQEPARSIVQRVRVNYNMLRNVASNCNRRV